MIQQYKIVTDNPYDNFVFHEHSMRLCGVKIQKEQVNLNCYAAWNCSSERSNLSVPFETFTSENRSVIIGLKRRRSWGPQALEQLPSRRVDLERRPDRKCERINPKTLYPISQRPTENPFKLTAILQFSDHVSYALRNTKNKTQSIW